MNEIERATLQQALHELPYAPLFATVSGAHLYGFASPDSETAEGFVIALQERFLWESRKNT